MEFKLPDIGEGVHEGELIRWLVKEGDAVKADQPLLEVMTDKATVEVPAPTSGTITGISAKDGQMIKVGQTLAQIGGGSAASTGAPSAAAGAAAPAAASTPAPTTAANTANAAPSQVQDAAQAGTQTKTPPPPPSTPKAPPAPAGAAPAAQGGSHLNPNFAAALSGGTSAKAPEYRDALATNSADTVPAAPIVRAMAQKAGIDLASVPASGPSVGGRNRVLEEDLTRFLNQAPAAHYGNGQGATAAGPAVAAPSAASAAPAKKAAAALPMPTRTAFGDQPDERKPVRGLRRVIAQAMVRSKYTAPHYSYVDRFEASQLVAVREAAKVHGEKYGVKITYLPFVIKAVVGALREFPEVNASLEESANGLELIVKKNYHIGFAVATPDGLLVPVIKHADQKSILEIAKEMQDLSNKVRAGKATSDELKGSTFTITSMGNIGGLFATPIINYPEVGILGVYKVQDEPIVHNGQVVAGKNMYLSLSLDHRVVDGAVGGLFCNAIIERLADPSRLLLELI